MAIAVRYPLRHAGPVPRSGGSASSTIVSHSVAIVVTPCRLVRAVRYAGGVGFTMPMWDIVEANRPPVRRESAPRHTVIRRRPREPWPDGDIGVFIATGISAERDVAGPTSHSELISRQL